MACSDLPVKSVTISRRAAASASICAATSLAEPKSFASSKSLAPAWTASSALARANSFSNALACAAPAWIFVSTSFSVWALVSAIMSLTKRSCSCAHLSAFRPVMASIRRTPAAIPPSLMILKRPMSPVRETCVPPHNSVEKPPICSTRTSSPYFSPKSIMAPVFWASSMLIMAALTATLAKMASLTRRSTSAISSAVTA